MNGRLLPICFPLLASAACAALALTEHFFAYIEFVKLVAERKILSISLMKSMLFCTVISIPGAYSPSECEEAHEAGADFIKLFPAVNLGVDYVKAITAPLSQIKFMVVGGITAENVGEYIKAGAVGVGTGSDLIIKDAVAEGNFARITERAKEYISAVSL